MPPQTRRTKTLKENICVSVKNKAKNNVKVNRKPLSDKTNSASDDNISILSCKKILKEDANKSLEQTETLKEKSRRIRRLPTRYEENIILKNLSNFNSLSPQKVNSPTTPKVTPLKINRAKLTPHKTPLRISNSPLVSKRPKRICRLPSKFDGQSVSPIKNGAIQPSHASTPISDKLKKPIIRNEHKNVKLQKRVQNNKETKKNMKVNEKNLTKRSHTELTAIQSAANVTSLTVSKQSVESDTLKMGIKRKSDTNQKKPTITTSMTTPSKTANNKEPTKNNSFRLLENKKKSLKSNSSKLDVYEFTFDPNEEPPPKKKKKKKSTKNISKPKKVVKSRYEKNLEKALAALKNTVASKNKIQLPFQQDKPQKKEPILNSNKNMPATNVLNPNVSNVSENKYNSIRVEDIAMQFQDTNDNDDNINYSPVNSPQHALPSPVHPNTTIQKPTQPILSSSIHSNVNSDSSERPISNKDPLNLQDNISFFDEQPVASSSMNVSVRHPLASPWRVEFNDLPIKWQVNSYVKPDKTPAIESSFINYNDNQKKHVYTNIITEANEPLPQIVDNPQPHTSNLKQTSIISFIKEVVEKKANKKKKRTIIKSNSLFDDVTHAEPIPSRKKDGIPEVIVERSNTSGEDIQSENENEHPQDNSENSAEVKVTEKISEKEGDKDITYFGFDDSENQENVSPVKKKIRKKTLKTQKRKALQVVNGEVNPSINNPMPPAATPKPTRIANQLNKPFDGTKIATEPPAFPEQNNNMNTEITNVNTDLMESNIDDDYCHYVHLFEDIEVVHHLKPTRKSYGKSKKVTFHHNTAVNSQDGDIENHGSCNEDNLDDLSFKLPSVREKKITKRITKKQQKSKKEEKEVEEWAAGFNSMCEDVEEFDLVIE